MPPPSRRDGVLYFEIFRLFHFPISACGSRTSLFHQKNSAQTMSQARGDLLRNPLFLAAVNNVPDADVNLLESFGGPTPSAGFPSTRNQLRVVLALNRWTNKICDQCLDKSNVSALQPCPACALAFYCSQECREKAAAAHAARCCKRDGPLDKGPMAIVIMKRDENKAPATNDGWEPVSGVTRNDSGAPPEPSPSIKRPKSQLD